MRIRSSAFVHSLAWALFVFSPATAAAEDGPTLYKQLCASCHEAGTDRAPNRDALRAMTAERVLTAMEGGPMLSMAAGRTGVERRAIAEFVTGKPFAQAFSTTPAPQAMCKPGGEFNPLTGPRWNAWGVNASNTRYQDAAMAGLSAADVSKLRVKWAFGFPGELSVDSQPTVAGGRVFAGTQSGAVYALSAATGCVHWVFQAAAAVRAAVSVGQIQTRSGSRVAAFIGDRSANVYAVDAASGELLWKTRVDDFPFARVTGSPTFHSGRLYVGVASGEETAGAVADYECCKFRGSLLALDAATGTQVWKTYTIEEPKRTTKNKVGTQLWGPSGSPIWSSPAIDTERNAVYVTTGNNYSGPATRNSDAFMAFDMSSGRLLWSKQMTAADDWNTSCRLPDQINCTNRDAPDHDFASPPIIVRPPERTPGHRLGTEVRRRPRTGSRSQRRIDLAGACRQGRHQRRRAVGVGRGFIHDVRGAVGPRPHSGSQQPGHRARSEHRRRDVRAAARLGSARVAHDAARCVHRTRSLQPGAVGRGQRDSRHRVFRFGRRTHPRIRGGGWEDRVGRRYGEDLRHGQRRAWPRRIAERRRPGDQRRHVVR